MNHISQSLRTRGLGLALLCAISTPIVAQDSTSTELEEDFFELSLEDLLNVEVTSVSKKAERLQDVAASIYVLTSEEIMNSGATTLHEALRLIPGYWGVQAEYSSTAPVLRNLPVDNGSRGTVLYLLDGTPILELMSATFSFANFDIPLDEIDRIEVIRGSGGTVYGANSATGVVNIFTKSPDKYDGLNARAEYASPGYTNVTVRAGKAINEKIAVSGYGKVRLFEGFGLMPEFDGDEVSVPKNDGTGDTTITNRFTEDYESQTMLSFGAKGVYKINDNAKLSLTTHYNTQSQTHYTNYDTDELLLGGSDVLLVNDITRSRFVGNLRLDYSFNDDHSLFARASSNAENDFLRVLGGYSVNNSIVDFEVQDNLTLGFNDLSIGANFRLVNFDVNNIQDPIGLAYVDPQSTENLTGFFLQDRIRLLDDKLNFILGIKAENFSLINDKYYLSPMAKVTYAPVENLTLWGGFTQSYTTPGFNNVNIDLILLKTVPQEFWEGQVSPLVYQDVYNKTFNGALAGGADSATAATLADQGATDFVNSDAGMGVIADLGDSVRAANGVPANNVGVINGTSTVPTQYQTWEVGVRYNLENVLSLESNFYYQNITDGITQTPSSVLFGAESPANPENTADYFYYGNYIKGITYGLETKINILPAAGTKIEISHVFTDGNWEYQENDDFDISSLSESQRDRTLSTPVMPKHVFRMRGSFALPKSLKFHFGIIHATKFVTDNSTFNVRYDYELQRHPNFISEQTGDFVSTPQPRTIVNLKLEKAFLNDDLTVYAFGNDIFNTGIIAATSQLTNVAMSRITGMYGVGANYKF